MKTQPAVRATAHGLQVLRKRIAASNIPSSCLDPPRAPKPSHVVARRGRSTAGLDGSNKESAALAKHATVAKHPGAARCRLRGRQKPGITSV